LTPPARGTVRHVQRVEFGDCDPARIVWFPNFFRWIDAASRHFFVACGVPPWHELEQSRGIIGTPLVDTQARFHATATYGDELLLDVHIAEWRPKTFVQRYRIWRADADGPADGTTLVTCDEVRIFGGRSATGKLFAHPVPEDLRRLCGGAEG
jgi:4-hydroxybenzoyl-CoA thioesterase